MSIYVIYTVRKQIMPLHLLVRINFCNLCFNLRNILINIFNYWIEILWKLCREVPIPYFFR